MLIKCVKNVVPGDVFDARALSRSTPVSCVERVHHRHHHHRYEWSDDQVNIDSVFMVVQYLDEGLVGLAYTVVNVLLVLSDGKLMTLGIPIKNDNLLLIAP